ncbi:MAG: hypothetical protein H7A46_13140 [Verrucomicrobiales bacterium]|nr:hypothetical protein [Verrucomicrobiales bacterium]
MDDSLREHLLSLNADLLKGWLKHMDVSLKGVTRKDQFVRLIEQQITLNLPAVLNRLSPAEHRLLADSAHQGRLLSPREFSARYDLKYPKISQYARWNEPVSLLVPFISFTARWSDGGAGLVFALIEPLRARLPEPPGLTVTPVELLPTQWHPEGKAPSGSPARLLQVFEGERVVPVELGRVLRLIQGGKVKVTPKGGRPTDAATRLVAQTLVVPDFDLEKPVEQRRDPWDTKYYKAAGAVRAHAWPVLGQQCGWARQKGGALVLTNAGRDILQQFTPEKYRAGVQRCLQDNGFDELNRINNIRGQGGRAKRWLSNPSLRRLEIVEAMGAYPVGQWLKFEEARRVVEATSGEWDVLPENVGVLYFCELQYGCIQSSTGLNRQYLRAFLMETLGTLGLLDVACVFPHDLWPDLGGGWGTDDLSFCGRYDGLLFVRLNALGAYALGLADDYEMTEEESPGLFRVLPNHDLVLTQAALNPADQAMLELLAVPQSDLVWRLDPGRMLGHVESGASFGELTEYLDGRVVGGIPENVRTFLAETEGRLDACRSRQDAVLLEWQDETLARLIATSTGTRKYCHHAGDNRIVVPAKNLAAFTRALKQLGYVLLPGR